MDFITIINTAYALSIVLDELTRLIIAIFGLCEAKAIQRGTRQWMVASPQATGNSVEQGAGTPQIRALSVQSLSSSITDLGPRKGLPFLVMLSSESSFFWWVTRKEQHCREKRSLLRRQCWWLRAKRKPPRVFKTHAHVRTHVAEIIHLRSCVYLPSLGHSRYCN